MSVQKRTVVVGYRDGKRHEIDFELKDTDNGPARGSH